MSADENQPDLPVIDPPIDAAFLEDLKRQDLANVARKARAGQPLSKREREMLEAEHTRLSETPMLAMTLEGAGQTAMDGMTQKELAEDWGVSLRSVKGWIAEGKAANDLCPLTRPGDFASWYSRMHAPRDCPQKLVLSAQRIMAGGKASAAVEAPEKQAVPVERIVLEESSKGLLAMLGRYRTAEAELYVKYMAAVDAGDEMKASFLLSEWSKMGEKLRMVEKSAPDALYAAGIYVKRDEVQRALGPLHAAVIKGFRQAFRMHRPALRMMTGAEEWNMKVDAIVDEVCEMLETTDFVEPLVLDDAA